MSRFYGSLCIDKEELIKFWKSSAWICKQEFPDRFFTILR